MFQVMAIINKQNSSVYVLHRTLFSLQQEQNRQNDFKNKLIQVDTQKETDNTKQRSNLTRTFKNPHYVLGGYCIIKSILNTDFLVDLAFYFPQFHNINLRPIRSTLKNLVQNHTHELPDYKMTNDMHDSKHTHLKSLRFYTNNYTKAHITAKIIDNIKSNPCF